MGLQIRNLCKCIDCCFVCSLRIVQLLCHMMDKKILQILFLQVVFCKRYNIRYSFFAFFISLYVFYIFMLNLVVILI